MKDKYPELTQLFGGYLNQDFMDEFGSADKALLACKANWTAEEIEKSRKELNEMIRSGYDEKTLEKLLNQLGCDYYYQSEWKSAINWIRHVEEILNQ